jgi:hypothetical protein
MKSLSFKKSSARSILQTTRDGKGQRGAPAI